MLLVFAIALVISQLAWIDVLFLPLVLLGPPLTGITMSLAGRPRREPALVWFLAGLGMLVSDYFVNHEDVVFHAVVAVVTAGVAAGAHALTELVRRRGSARSGSGVTAG
jgi:hypothetical protein